VLFLLLLNISDPELPFADESPALRALVAQQVHNHGATTNHEPTSPAALDWSQGQEVG
jgi:hypothetical protein